MCWCRRALDRQCKIVGRAFCLEIMEDREIELVIGDIDAASHRFTAPAPCVLGYFHGRTRPAPHGQRSLHVCRSCATRRSWRRDIAGAACGVEGLSATAESLPPASAMRIRRTRRSATESAARGPGEPVEDCLDSVVFRALVSRPLHHIAGQQISRIDVGYWLPTGLRRDRSPFNTGYLGRRVIQIDIPCWRLQFYSEAAD